MYTILGIIAVLLWSTTMGFSRSLVEQLGAMTAGACIYLVSGAVGCGYLLARGRLAPVRRMPRLYLFGCGAMVVVYMVLIYMAIGMAATRRQVVGVGIINYLWPGLTLVFSVPVLGKRAGPLLAPGVLLAFAGAVLAATSGAQFTAAGFLQDLSSARAPYLLALGAAVLWALYSNLSRRWAGAHEGGAMPIFLLAAGVVLGMLRLLFHEQPHWQTHTCFELAYMSLLPALLAYAFWDYSMRRGNLVLVAAVAYLAPVLSTTFTSVYLHVAPGRGLWIACVLVVAGAVVCKLSVTEPAQEATADDAGIEA